MEAVEAAPVPAREPESEFITGPVAARREAPIDRRVVRGTMLGGRLIDDRQSAPVDEEDDLVDEDDLIGAEGGEDEDDEDVDEELEEQEDALFEVACAAVEQGEALTWQETCSLLITTEVTDPRLALLVSLIMEGAPEGESPKPHTPLPLTGKRLLAQLEELGLGELVAEAREVAALAPGQEGESEDERELVRTNARELNQLSKRELAAGSRGQQGQRDPGRPLRASDVKPRRTALSTGAMSPRRGG